jgi:NAD(P)-dependent dehydrogenase (short-subunit alcohol dehydrogenase family)/acyl dehydratase
VSRSRARSAPLISRPLRFVDQDLTLFAAASGDRNPLHLDDAFARRSPFGARIVHGSLVALALLGVLPADALAAARSVRAIFGGPVLLDEDGTAEAWRSNRGSWELRLTGRGRVLTRITVGGVEPGDARPTPARPIAGTPPARDRAMRTEPRPESETPPVGTRIEGSYRPGRELADVARTWGVEALDPALLAGLAWASYVVGMELPGLHGLFAAARLTALGPEPAGPRGVQSLELREHDERSGGLLIDGLLRGSAGERTAASLEAFTREPVAHPGTPLSPRRVPKASGETVVVVGGSRGFGAAVTLAMLARGHSVHAVYSTSGDAADELARRAGPSGRRLTLHRADARDPAALMALCVALEANGEQVSGLVLAAAPPPIPMGVTAQAAAGIADYVARSVALVATPLGAFLPVLSPDAFVVFCSSAALAAPPRDWPHYAAAKGGIEGLARWTAAAEPALRCVVARLPKMLTDMTNSPGARLDALAPDGVAGRLVDRLEADAGRPGLTILEPEEL